MRDGMRVFLIGLLLMLAAACGSGGETATSTDEVADDAPMEEAPAEGGGELAPEDCTEAAQAMSEAVQAVPQALTGGVDSAALQQQVDTLQALAEAAPAEIAEDFQTVVGGLANFLQILVDSGYDPSSGQPPPPEVLSELQTASSELSSADFQGAVTRVQTWFQENCGQG